MNKPIITLAQKDASVSRFPFGYISDRHLTYRYENLEDAYEFVFSGIKRLFPNV